MAAPRARIVFAWLPAVLYMAGIFALSSFEMHAPVIEEFPLRDKGLHVVEYAGLGLLLAHATARTWPGRPRWRVVAVAVVIGVAWGVLDELHQALVPGRLADLMDVAADAVGIVIGAALRTGLGLLRGMQARGA